MTKRAQLANGTVLEFPDNTPDAVMDRVVKQHTSGGGKPAKPKAPDYTLSDLLGSKLTGGLSDKAAALTQGAIDWARGGKGGFGDNYQRAQSGRDQARAQYQAEHPVADWASLPVNFMGGGPGFVAKPAVTLRQFARNPVAATKVAARTPAVIPKVAAPTMRGLAKVGAIGGAAAGAGQSRGTAGEQAVQTVGSTLGGAVLTPAIAKAIPAVAGLVSGGTRAITNTARAVTGKEIPGRSGEILLRDLADQGMTPNQAAKVVQEAHENGVPMALMDTGDELRGRAAALSRLPGPTRPLVRDVAVPRQTGQGERIQTAITRDLGPVANVREASEGLIKTAQAKAGPFYEKAYAAPGFDRVYPQIESMLDRPSMKGAISRAFRIAQEEGRDPTALGFIVKENGDIGLVPQTGRYSSAPVMDPRADLSRETVRGANGSEFQKVGPTDLVGWLRRNGGIQDQGGDLSHMGLNNAPRRGMDHVGQEHRFGPLVADSGMNLDDAAVRAWEAGYFPELNDRPSVNEFLDAVRSTHEGRARNFLPDDAAQLDRFNAVTDDRNAAQQTRFETGKAPSIDNSTDAGPREFAPMSAYGETEKNLPTWQTLDYIKRGMDDVVETYRDKTTGRLNLDTEGRAINSTLREFIDKIDGENLAYADARHQYAGPAKMATALNKGSKIGNKDAETIWAETRDLSPAELEQYRLGARSALSKLVEGKTDGSDKVNALINTPRKREVLGHLFGGNEGLDRFIATLGQEGELAKTYQRVNTGSNTPRDLADDANLSGSGVLANAGGRALRGQGIISNAISTIGDLVNYGSGEGAKRLVAELASGLSETDPAALRQALKGARRAAAAARLKGAPNSSNLTIGNLGASAGGKTSGTIASLFAPEPFPNQ